MLLIACWCNPSPPDNFQMTIDDEPTAEQWMLLANYGLVSDNCITWADVYIEDKIRAVQFLNMIDL
jgi:hypothetical protein